MIGTSATQEWIAARWIDCLSQLLESATGEAPVVRMNPKAFDQPNTQDAIACAAQLSLGGEFSTTVAVPEETWRDLGQALAAGSEEKPDAEGIRAAIVDLFRQGLRKFSAEIGTRLGLEISCEDDPSSAPVAAGICFELMLPTGARGLMLSLSPKLVALLDQSSRTGIHTENSRTLDLLLDVELPVSISFGRAQVPLKDVVRLTSGSIVELNRMVSEPVEMIVNNCVIARGEVVVVEGNYGIRIRQIVSRQDRLRTLN